jgi:hypothetical protein
MHRSSTVLLAVLLCAGAATGCSSNSDSDAKPAASKTPTISKETRYLTAAREITFNGTPSDDELLALPPKWCDGLAGGHSVEWLFDLTGGGGLYPVGMEWGTARPDANELLLVGVKTHCPDQTAAVTAELRSTDQY